MLKSDSKIVRMWLHGKIILASHGDDHARQVAFETIWKLYQKRLYYYIRTFSKAEAPDLLQEVMLKIYSNLDRLNPARSLSAWIYTIARNHCLNHLEKKRIQTVSEEVIDISERASTQATPGEMLEDQELLKKIDDVIKTLSPDHQQMVYLYFFENFKYREIAKIMEKPVGTIKSRLHIIKKELQNHLGEYR